MLRKKEAKNLEMESLFMEKIHNSGIKKSNVIEKRSRSEDIMKNIINTLVLHKNDSATDIRNKRAAVKNEIEQFKKDELDKNKAKVKMVRENEVNNRKNINTK
jgi:hypothetical protein